MKFNPMHRMIGTSACVTGPSSVFTVTSSSVTFVSGEKISPFATTITCAFKPVDSLVVPTSKSGVGRMGWPRSSRPSVAMKRIRRFQFGDMMDMGYVVVLVCWGVLGYCVCLEMLGVVLRVWICVLPGPHEAMSGWMWGWCGKNNRWGCVGYVLTSWTEGC
jgi:hypothetical protein